MAQKLEKLKGSRYYGFVLLFAMLIFFYGVFKILTPEEPERAGLPRLAGSPL